MVPEDKVELLLKNDAAFARHALMVHNYDEDEFVICRARLTKFLVRRSVGTSSIIAEDAIDRGSPCETCTNDAVDYACGSFRVSGTR